MTWVDWMIVIALAASAIGGLAQGFFRTACSLVGLVLGLALAAWNYALLADVMMPVLRVESVADAVAFLIIAIVVMVIFHIFGTILGRAMKWLGLGCLDTLAGGALGFMQGVVWVTLALLVAVAFFPGSQLLAQSRLPRQFFGALHVSERVTPHELAEKLRLGLRLLEQDSPGWMHTGKKPS